MREWHGWTDDGAHGCQITGGAIRSMDRMCQDAGDIETGGILVGRYVDNATVAHISEATPPPRDSQRGRTWFARGVQGLRQLLARRWAARERVHYLGEWHFHPCDVVVPSVVDLSQMTTIALADEYQCPEPVLLIVGRRAGQRARPMRVFVCPRGEPAKEILPQSSDLKPK
jgi:integrative and conjugative element protein (TIGR02256 family)